MHRNVREGRLFARERNASGLSSSAKFQVASPLGPLTTEAHLAGWADVGRKGKRRYVVVEAGKVLVYRTDPPVPLPVASASLPVQARLVEAGQAEIKLGPDAEPVVHARTAAASVRALVDCALGGDSVTRIINLAELLPDNDTVLLMLHTSKTKSKRSVYLA